MVKIPASDYLPFNSETPLVFSRATNNNYVVGAFLMLMVYDHALTFDREIEWIWTLRWRLPKFLFLINRYIISPLIIFVSVVNMVYPVALPFCSVIDRLSPWVAVFSYTTAEAVLVIRVCALYYQRKLFVRLLTGFYALEIIAVVVNTAFLTKQTEAVYFFEYLPGCWSIVSPNDVYSFWVPFTIFDGIIILVTLYRFFSFDAKSRSPTIKMLARDSLVYFVVLFATQVVNTVTFRVGATFDLMMVSECISCISISRMMMNIRGLVAEDPDHTLYLQTLNFASNNSEDHPHRRGVRNPTTTSDATAYEVA